MMSTYLGDDADGLDGLEFMPMAEAGELGHVAIIGKLNERAGKHEVQEFVEWALPIQERHFERSKEAALTLAAQEDPNTPNKRKRPDRDAGFLRPGGEFKEVGKISSPLPVWWVRKLDSAPSDRLTRSGKWVTETN
jgi:hypothetical protein